MPPVPSRAKPSLLRRTLRVVDGCGLAALVTVLLLAFCFLIESPIAFQKASSIVVGSEPAIDWERASPVLDARRVIGSIPYQSPEAIYEVLPQRIYERTMLEGHGNCANKVRGLSVFLVKAGVPFHRVDMLDVGGFLYGMGHTLARVKYELDGQTRVGLIDVLEGALLVDGSKPMDLDALRRAKPFTIGLLPLNRRCDGASEYYGTFLEGSVIGTTDPSETRRYFRFIESIHIPIGELRFQRLFFNAVAVVCGQFPLTRVSQADYERLFKGRMIVVYAAAALRWSTRLLLVLTAASIVLRIVDRAGRWTTRSRDERPARAARSDRSGVTMPS